MVKNASPSFSIGDYVRVTDPTTPHLDGCVGRVLSHPGDDDNGTYRVDCATVSGPRKDEEHDGLFLKSYERRHLSSATSDSNERAFLLGDIVEIHGLTSTIGKTLNSRRGEIVRLPDSTSSETRFGVCVGSLHAKGFRSDPSVWIKSIRSVNLLLVPPAARALLDLKRLAAEVVAECLYVWRGTGDTEAEYMGAYATRQKIMMTVNRAVVVGDALKLSVETKSGKKGEVLVRCESIGGDGGLRVVGVTSEEEGDGSVPLPWEMLVPGESGLKAVTSDGNPAVLFAKDVVEKLDVSKLKALFKKLFRRGRSVSIVCGNGIPPDYDRDESSYQAPFPKTFDVRVLDKVVTKEIPCGLGGAPYITLEVHPHSTRCISPPTEEHPEFLLCKTPQMQRDIGGYDAALRLLTRVLSVGKCNEAAMILCVMLQQLEPEIMPVFNGHVVYDVRIESAGYIHFDPQQTGSVRSPVTEMMGDFSSRVPTMMGPMSDCAPQNSWSKVHTWLSFQIHENGTSQRYVMDLSAPQFNIFGERITVDPAIPDVFVFVQKATTHKGETVTTALTEKYTNELSDTTHIPVAYKNSGTASIPLNFHSMALLSWIYTHNNLFTVANTKLSDICANFLERRYPKSVRQLPRPYNYPEFPGPGKFKFFGIGSTVPEDLTAFDLINELRTETVDWLRTLSSPEMTVDTFRRFLLERSEIVRALEDMAGVTMIRVWDQQNKNIEECTRILGNELRCLGDAKVLRTVQ